MDAGLSINEAVRAMLLLMPRLVGRAKRLPVPAPLRELDLTPRHLALFAQLRYAGPLSVNELAERLEVAPTTVSLMVAQLSRRGVLERREDDADRRRRIIAIAPDMAEAVSAWLDGSANAWATVFGKLNAGERRVIVQALQDYESSLVGEVDPDPS